MPEAQHRERCFLQDRSMVAKALKENGHKVILLDVFMGYSDREEDLTGIFDRADEISVQVSDIPTEAPASQR